MNIKNTGYKQFIPIIVLINSTGIMFLVLLISCYLETKSAEYLYGLFFLLSFVALNLLFFAIRKSMLSKVVIEDGKIKEKYFKKTLKEIDLKDIRFICINVNYVYISSNIIKMEEIGVGRRLNKILFSKENINFGINLPQLDILLDSINLEFCYVSTMTTKEVKEKISEYFSIREINWIKSSKK